MYNATGYCEERTSLAGVWKQSALECTWSLLNVSVSAVTMQTGTEMWNVLFLLYEL
jgi:hypothetical protein